ncbi:hypothetical protein BpHYR1_018085, partial [Brachionus plicatilis]
SACSNRKQINNDNNNNYICNFLHWIADVDEPVTYFEPYALYKTYRSLDALNRNSSGPLNQAAFIMPTQSTSNIEQSETPSVLNQIENEIRGRQRKNQLKNCNLFLSTI